MLVGRSSLHLRNRFRWPIVIRAGQNKYRRSLTYNTQQSRTHSRTGLI